MKTINLLSALVLLVVATSPAQLLINEVHGFGAGASPSLPGDYIEIWNQSGTNIDLAGYSLDIWSGDTGVAQIRTIPSVCGVTNTSIVPANGFWIFQEAGVLGTPLTGTLAGLIGMRGMPTSWSSSSNFGARLIDPLGNCVDYIYIRRGTTAPPALPPNIVAPCTWTLGNVSTSGSGRGHAQRMTNTNTSSFTDWADSVTATVGTPGAENTILGATQTPTGPVGSTGPFAYEANSAEASMTVNGVVGSPCAPTVINVPFNTGATATVNLSTNQVGGVLGGHYEIGVQPGPMIPGLPLGNGELINVDYMAPNFFWVNGGQAGADFFAMPGTQLPGATGGSMTASFTLDTLCPINYTLQGVIVGNEAVAPLSVYLTQATQIAIAPTATRLFLGDDANFNYALTGPSVSFYGASFANIFVCSNGRVAFGAGDNDFSPTLTEAINNVAFVGCWTDLEPNAGGCISVFEDGLGEVSVAYEGVRNWGTPEFTTFVVTIKATGEIVLSNMDNVAAYANNSFVGISRGNTLATDAGAVDYTLGAGITLSTSDMIYNFVTAGLGSPAPGITSISFTPNPFTNYDWTSL